MKRLMVAFLLVGAFLLGAYVDRVTAAPYGGTTLASLGPSPAGPAVLRDSVPLPSASPSRAELQDEAERSCVPPLRRQGMTRLQALRACGQAASPHPGG